MGVLYSVLIFLFPLALYCLVLAYINRSRRPVMASGLWDSVGLLFGLSGFLLWIAPAVVFDLIDGLWAGIPAAEEPETAAVRRLAVVLGLYLLLAVVAASVIAVRRHKTVIYNVDTGLVRQRFAVALADLGLDFVNQAGRLLVAPADSFTAAAAEPPEVFTANPGVAPTSQATPTKKLTAAPGGPSYAEVVLDPFPAMCHCTLHWENYSSPLRRAIDDRLHLALEDAAPLENPAASWFLGFSGLMIFSMTMLVSFLVFLTLFTRRA